MLSRAGRFLFPERDGGDENSTLRLSVAAIVCRYRSATGSLGVFFPRLLGTSLTPRRLDQRDIRSIRDARRLGWRDFLRVYQTDPNQPTRPFITFPPPARRDTIIPRTYLPGSGWASRVAITLSMPQPLFQSNRYVIAKGVQRVILWCSQPRVPANGQSIFADSIK